MALSSDPDKRERQLANLRRGPAAAAKAFGLPVVGYDEPPPAPQPKTAAPTAKPAAEVREPAAELETSDESAGGISTLAVMAGIGALAVLILLLNRNGARNGG